MWRSWRNLATRRNSCNSCWLIVGLEHGTWRKVCLSQGYIRDAQHVEQVTALPVTPALSESLSKTFLNSTWGFSSHVAQNLQSFRTWVFHGVSSWLVLDGTMTSSFFAWLLHGYESKHVETVYSGSPSNMKPNLGLLTQMVWHIVNTAIQLLWMGP